MNPNKEIGVERTLKVSKKNWADWDAAAIVAGVSRNAFIVTVANYAARQMLEGKVPGGPGRPPRPQDSESGRFLKRDSKIFVSITTVTGKFHDLEVIYPNDPVQMRTIKMDREVFLDIACVEEFETTKTGRWWQKNPNFSTLEKDIDPGWWILNIFDPTGFQQFIIEILPEHTNDPAL